MLELILTFAGGAAVGVLFGSWIKADTLLQAENRAYKRGSHDGINLMSKQGEENA